MESQVENYMPSFKNISGRSLMVYTFPDKGEVIHYQLQMLANNSIPGILKADSIGMDGEIRLQYDITSLVSIKKLLERREMGRKDILNLIKNIITMVEGLEHYLLDAERIIYDSGYIFADPQDLKLNFAYLPVKTLQHDANSLKSFLMSLIINDIQFTNEQSDNFVQKLIELLKTENFKVSSLRAYVKDMGFENQKPAIDSAPDTLRTVIEEKEPAPPIVRPDVKSVIKVSKLGYPTKSYVIMGSVIAILILFCLTLVISGVMSPSNPDSLLSLFGFLMISGAVTYLVYTKVFTPEKKIEKIALPQKVEYVNKAFTVPILPSEKKEGNPVNHYTQPAKPQIAPAVKTARQETASSSQHRDKTVILDIGKLKFPYIKRTLENSFETIILNSFPFMLGRLDGQVNFCINNPAIGKLHAEINKTPDGFTITDMNSLNGTFVNGERVQTGKETNLKNGDHITLGNEEFVFFCE